MDIAYIAPVVYPFVKGGVEKRIHEVGSRLAERGHEVTVYSRHWWDGPAVRKHAGMTLRAIGPTRDLYADGDRRSIPSALELAVRLVGPLARRGNEHDLLATPVAPYFHVFAAKLAGTLRSTPLVVTWHEVWGEYWYRHMGRLGMGGDFVERVAARLPQHAVVPSALTAQNLAGSGFDRSEITIIPNGIDVDAVQATTPVADGFDVLYAGRLIEDKNVDLLLDAFDRAPDHLTLGIIGDGPYSEALREQAAALDADDRITFLGFLEAHEAVLAHMRAATIFVSPSTREGFGITLLEAMAAECTVITVEHPNSAADEVVADAGFVTDPTVDAVADALQRVAEGERPPTDSLTRAAAYDWTATTDRTERYFQHLLRG